MPELNKGLMKKIKLVTEDRFKMLRDERGLIDNKKMEAFKYAQYVARHQRLSAKKDHETII